MKRVLTVLVLVMVLLPLAVFANEDVVKPVVPDDKVSPEEVKEQMMKEDKAKGIGEKKENEKKPMEEKKEEPVEKEIVKKEDPNKEYEKRILKWDDRENLKLLYFELKNKKDKTPNDYYYLAKTCYYLGKTSETEEDKLKYYEGGNEFAAEGLKIDDKHTDLLYIKAVNMGKIGETKGVMKSLFMVKPIKELCQRILDVDKKYAGAYHILGVLNRKVPGLFGGDIKESIKQLRKSCELEPEYSLHFIELAKSLEEKKKYDEAKKVLNNLINGDFPKDRLEEKDNKEEAKELLKELK